MNFYFDTSALMKKYIDETGSDCVVSLMKDADEIFLSLITEIEAHSTCRRLLAEKAISEKDYENLIRELDTDFQYYTFIPLDETVTRIARSLVNTHQLRSLDSIQLASAILIRDEIDAVVVCDDRIIRAGEGEGVNVINPVV